MRVDSANDVHIGFDGSLLCWSERHFVYSWCEHVELAVNLYIFINMAGSMPDLRKDNNY